MKKLHLLALCFISAGAFAQTDTGKNRPQGSMILSGEAVKPFIPPITDKNTYDADGNILDSVAGTAMLKTFEYQFGLSIPKGMKGLHKTITKIDPVEEEQLVYLMSQRKKPESPKLQIGEELDLTAFGGRIDENKVKGKAIVLMFWCSGCYIKPIVPGGGYWDFNEIVSKYAPTGKVEFYAITHHPYDVAGNALQKAPIVGAHTLFDSGNLTLAFQTNNKPLLVVTNKKHKITYAITGMVATTSWKVNRLLADL